MKVKSIPSTWIYREKHRLDCGPYMSGALEARMILEALPIVKTPLGQLTNGHAGGIYNGPMFKRNYVSSREHGVPFLTSSSMLLADLSNVGLLRKKDAQSKKLAYLRLEEGMTLISCSGSIGRMVYVRPEMAGMWSSQDNLKVVPDRSKILPGYLYAFLSSKFGVPQVVSGTYGAIIQHIEPEHIANLPVPRLGEKIERQVHDLVQQAAEKRSEASKLHQDLIREFEEACGFPPLGSPAAPYPFSITTAKSSDLQSRADGFYHSEYHLQARTPILAVPHVTVAELSDSIVEPARFKRRIVDDPKFGVPFFGTSAMMMNDPQASYFLPSGQPNIASIRVPPETILISRSGQVSGIIGTAVLPIGDLRNGTITEDAIRVFCRDEESAGYLYVALSSEYGRRQLKARTYGSSIPHLDVRNIGAVVLPKIDEASMRSIGERGFAVAGMRTEGVRLERSAVSIVEAEIDRMGAD